MRLSREESADKRRDRFEHDAPVRKPAAVPNPVLAAHGLALDGLGNRALLSLLRSGRLQRKARISQPGDPLEHEADRAADAVVAGAHPARPADAHSGPTEIQRSPVESAAGPTPGMGTAVQLYGGRTLDRSTRALMESRFGESFGDVRIHTGHDAAETAGSLHSRAFTVGADIVFAKGQFAPETTEGQRLLAHELAHVVQQRQTVGPVAGGKDTERDAHEAARQVTAGGTPNVRERAAPGTVQKDDDDDDDDDGGGEIYDFLGGFLLDMSLGGSSRTVMSAVSALVPDNGAEQERSGPKTIEGGFIKAAIYAPIDMAKLVANTFGLDSPDPFHETLVVKYDLKWIEANTPEIFKPGFDFNQLNPVYQVLVNAYEGYRAWERNDRGAIGKHLFGFGSALVATVELASSVAGFLEPRLGPKVTLPKASGPKASLRDPLEDAAMARTKPPVPEASGPKASLHDPFEDAVMARTKPPALKASGAKVEWRVMHEENGVVTAIGRSENDYALIRIDKNTGDGVLLHLGTGRVVPIRGGAIGDVPGSLSGSTGPSPSAGGNAGALAAGNEAARLAEETTGKDPVSGESHTSASQGGGTQETAVSSVHQTDQVGARRAANAAKAAQAKAAAQRAAQLALEAKLRRGAVRAAANGTTGPGAVDVESVDSTVSIVTGSGRPPLSDTIVETNIGKSHEIISTVRPDGTVHVAFGEKSTTISLTDETGNNMRLVRDLGISAKEARQVLQELRAGTRKTLISFAMDKDPVAFLKQALHDPAGFWESDAFGRPPSEQTRLEARKGRPGEPPLSEYALVFEEERPGQYTPKTSKTTPVTEYQFVDPITKQRISGSRVWPRAVVRVNESGVIVEIVDHVMPGTPAEARAKLIELFQRQGWKVDLP